MGSSVAKTLPDFLAQVSIQGFDYDACNNGTLSACWSYLSFCAFPVTIDVRPPLLIQPGIGLSTSLKIFDTVMGIKLRISLTELDFAVVAPPITMLGGQLKIWESTTRAGGDTGPNFAMKVNILTGEFFSKFKGYAKIGTIAEGSLETVLTSTHMQLKATDLSIFNGVLRGNISISIQAFPPRLEELSVDLDFSKISPVVQDLATKLADPLINAKNQVTPIVEKMGKIVNHAKKQLQGRQDDMHSKNKNCENKRRSLNRKKSDENHKCDRIRKRCWKVGWHKQCEHGWQVRAKQKMCKAKVHIQCKPEEVALSLSYQAIKLAQKALQVASHTLKESEKHLAAVEHLYSQIAETVQEIVYMVSDVQLLALKAKFEAGIGSSTAAFKVEAKIKATVETYSFEANLFELAQDIMKIAGILVEKIFKQVTDAAQMKVTDAVQEIVTKEEEMALRTQ